MKKPLVSVIIPVFNSEQYLSQCLDSVLHQTYSDLEIIAIDDGSSDGSLGLCRQYSVCDTRITVLQQENKGVSAARNIGLAHAKGELITFIDADDWVDPTHVQQLVEGLQGQKYDCSICGYWLEYPRKLKQHIFPQVGILSGDEAIEAILSPYLFHGSVWNKMFRTPLIRQYAIQLRESIYYFEDALFCAMYFTHCTAINCVQSSTYHYRRHPDSALMKTVTTAEWLERRLTSVLALESVHSLCRSSRAQRLCFARRNMECAEILRCILANGIEAETTEQLKQTIRKELWPVLSAPLHMKEKIIYLLTSLSPNTFAAFSAVRKKRFF